MDSHPKAAGRTGDWLSSFLPLLGPLWKPLAVAAVAMVVDAALTVFRPWPLKVVIDLFASIGYELQTIA